METIESFTGVDHANNGSVYISVRFLTFSITIIEYVGGFGE